MVQQILHHADAITRAQDFTGKLISTFSQRYREPLVLTRADNFARLADCVNLIDYEVSGVAREVALSFSRYDVAALLCQHHLKSHLDTRLESDQHHAFIDAIFPKLYSKSGNEYRRMMLDIDNLICAIPEAALSNELEV
jgi:hypothetical protein